MNFKAGKISTIIPNILLIAIIRYSLHVRKWFEIGYDKLYQIFNSKIINVEFISKYFIGSECILQKIYSIKTIIIMFDFLTCDIEEKQQ